MAETGSAHRATSASSEAEGQSRAARARHTSEAPQRAQQGTPAASAAPAVLDSLSRLQRLADASPRVAQMRRLQALADAAAGLPSPSDAVEAAPPNRTGLPDGLKAGVESLSGLSMDHVRVHYNSAQPAQLNALAYAQGGDIHVAPGQERHLPHEAWHVVQQAQGRVRPTLQLKDGVPVNDDAGLEREADLMGERALQRWEMITAPSPVAVPRQPLEGTSATVQRKLFIGGNQVTKLPQFLLPNMVLKKR